MAEELERLAQRIVSHPELWRPLAGEGKERAYECLYLDDSVGIWVITWLPGNDTGMHDHDGCSSAVVVAEGTIREERPRWDGEDQIIDPTRGESFNIKPHELHRMHNVSTEPATTIHCYSPPLAQTGRYSRCEDGSIRRDLVDGGELGG